MPGKMFIAPEGVSGDALTSDEYYAGEMDKKLTLCVRENVYKVRDLRGKDVCDIRFGGKLEVSGGLAAVTPRAMMRLLGARRSASGGYEVADAPASGGLCVCIVCPVYGSGEEFSIVLHTSSGSSGTFGFDPCGRDGVDFTLVSERSFGDSSAVLKFGERTGAR